MPKSLSPVTVYPVVAIQSAEDLQPGDVWTPAHPFFERCVFYEKDNQSVLAYSSILGQENAYYKHISQFPLPPRVMRTGKPPRTILDVLPSEADEEASDNYHKSMRRWSY